MNTSAADTHELVDSSIAYAEALCALVLDDPLLSPHLTDGSRLEWRTRRVSLEGRAGLAAAAPMGADLAQKLRWLERWPPVALRGHSAYTEIVRIDLLFPVSQPTQIDPTDGSRWYVAGEPTVNVTASSIYSAPYAEAQARMALFAAVCGLAERLIDAAKTTQLVARVETGAEAELREARELQQQKIEAISAHVHSCRERRGLKAGHVRRVPSFDALALGLQPADGAYEVTVRVRWREHRRYVLYVGLPGGALLRRLD